jgi:hypothetical protein
VLVKVTAEVLRQLTDFVPSDGIAAINLSTITLTQVRDLHGSRQRVRVWRYDNDTEHDGRALVECWHVRDVHCLLILRRGEEMPEHAASVECTELSHQRGIIQGWTMIRIEEQEDFL